MFAAIVLLIYGPGYGGVLGLVVGFECQRQIRPFLKKHLALSTMLREYKAKNMKVKAKDFEHKFIGLLLFQVMNTGSVNMKLCCESKVCDLVTANPVLGVNRW